MRNLLVIGDLRHAFARFFALGNSLPEWGWSVTIVTPMVEDALVHLDPPRQFLERVRIVEVHLAGDALSFLRHVFFASGLSPEESIVDQLTIRLGMKKHRSRIESLARALRGVAAFPDSGWTWRAPALRTANALLTDRRFEAILSSSPLPTNHIIASDLKKHFGIFWIADFRDPWTQAKSYSYGFVRRRLEESLERRVMRSADVITAATPEYAQRQERFYGRPVVSIPLGFDPSVMAQPAVPLTHRFTITYAGFIYERGQDPGKLLVAIRRLLDRGTMRAEDIHVRLYGLRRRWLDEYAKSLGLTENVTQFGTVSRSESVRRQRESHVLWLLNWEDPKGRGTYPRKVFEYLAARRPILATGGLPNDDLRSLIESTGVGVYAPAVEDIEAALSAFYQAFIEQGQVPYKGNPNLLNHFSHDQVARQFALLLEGVGNRTCGDAR